MNYKDNCPKHKLLVNSILSQSASTKAALIFTTHLCISSLQEAYCHWTVAPLTPATSTKNIIQRDVYYFDVDCVITWYGHSLIGLYSFQWEKPVCEETVQSFVITLQYSRW